MGTDGDGAHGTHQRIAVGSGACLLVPAQVFTSSAGSGRPCSSLRGHGSLLAFRLAGCGLVCPEARVLHDYDFGRNASKFFHLERNRLIMLAADYELLNVSRSRPR